MVTPPLNQIEDVVDFSILKSIQIPNKRSCKEPKYADNLGMSGTGVFSFYLNLCHLCMPLVMFSK